MDATKMEAGIRLFLDGLGERFPGDDLDKTPGRVARAWADDLVSGYATDPVAELTWTAAPELSGPVLAKDIRSCHINELTSGYPYRELFANLQRIGYDRVTLMEVQPVPELADAKQPAAAIRFMNYYRALWTELTNQIVSLPYAPLPAPRGEGLDQSPSPLREGRRCPKGG